MSRYNNDSNQKNQPMLEIDSVGKFPNQQSKLSFEISILNSNLSKMIQQKNIYQKSHIQKHKDNKFIMLIVFILSISAFQYGYALSEISTVPIKILQVQFSIDFNLGIAQGLLVGIMPVGGILGALLNKLFILYLTRKHTHYVLCLANLISTILVQIPNIYSLLVGRLILGICCGIYTVIAPTYIKQIAPKSLVTLLGSLFGLGKVTGVFLCYVFGLILQSTTWVQYWKLMFVIPGVLSLIQTIGIFLWVPNSPVQMVEKNRLDEAKQVIKILYQDKYVDQILQEFIIVRKLVIENQENQKLQVDKYSDHKLRAFIMAIQMSFLRQFCGANTLITYGGLIISKINSSLGTYTPIIINGVQLLYTVLQTFYISKEFGRRSLFLVSVALICLINLVLTIGSAENLHLIVVVFMIIFMAVFGGLFSSISWAYPAQIIPANQTTIPNLCNWLGLSIITIFPPIIADAMPNNSQWPVFCFFTIYCFFAEIYMYLYLVQSKDIPYKILITKF